MEICLIEASPSEYVARMRDGLTALGHRVGGDAGGTVLIDCAALPGPGGLDPSRTVALVRDLRFWQASVADIARRVVATSEPLADALAATCQVARDRIAVVAPGIDDLPRSPGSAGPTCRVLAADELVPANGFDVLMRALAKLFDLDWHLTIAGPATDPAHAADLRALAGALGIAGQVAFVPEPDWSGADLFALSPHSKGYGSAFAQALRRGLPVAATSVGAVPALLSPDTGTVTAPGDTEQLAKALRRLIYDKTLRRDMAEAAWQAGRLLPSWPDQAAKLAAVLADK